MVRSGRGPFKPARARRARARCMIFPLENLRNSARDRVPWRAFSDVCVQPRENLPLLTTIEDLFLRPAVKKAIILLLSRGHIKVLKDALAHLGPYQTLM